MNKFGFDNFFQGLILDLLVCSWLFPIGDPSLEAAASHLQATCLVLGATPEAISWVGWG